MTGGMNHLMCPKLQIMSKHGKRNTALRGAATTHLAETTNPNISIQTDDLKAELLFASCAQVDDKSRKNCCCASQMVLG